MLSTCMNPILYALINESFRNAFLSIVRPFLSACTKSVAMQTPPPNRFMNGHQALANFYPPTTLKNGQHKKEVFQ